MNTRAMPDLSTIEVSQLDSTSLRLVTRAVEIEARRLRAQAMRDLVSRLAGFVRSVFSLRVTTAVPTASRAHAR